MMDGRERTGKEGERIAERHLRKKGFKIIHRRWRHSRGEIDLIAQDGDEVVFVEVKTRRSATYGSPLLAIGHKKQIALIDLSYAYMADLPPGRRFRIDAVSITFTPGGPVIEHILHAVEGCR